MLLRTWWRHPAEGECAAAAAGPDSALDKVDVLHAMAPRPNLAREGQRPAPRPVPTALHRTSCPPRARLPRLKGRHTTRRLTVAHDTASALGQQPHVHAVRARCPQPAATRTSTIACAKGVEGHPSRVPLLHRYMERGDCGASPLLGDPRRDCAHHCSATRTPGSACPRGARVRAGCSWLVAKAACTARARHLLCQSTPGLSCAPGRRPPGRATIPRQFRNP